MQPIVETPRLYLRKIALDDADAFHVLHADEEVMRYLGGRVYTPEETRAQLERFLARHDAQGYGMMAMIERATGTLIGRCGFLVQDLETGRELEIGWALRRASWGQGFAVEAAGACRDHALSSLGARRVVSLVDPANARSARVAERIGMHVERMVDFKGARVRLFVLER